MSGLIYITEEEVRERINREATLAQSQGKDFIRNSNDYSSHLIDVGKKGKEISEIILSKNPDLDYCLNSNIPLVAGFFHDFEKIWVGDAYHEIYGAHKILNDGEELGLVKGGTSEERRNTLVRIASCLPGDAALLEELGNNFPITAEYPEHVTSELINKYQSLLKELPMDEKNFAIPDTLEKMIALYADFTDGGITIEQRLKDIHNRYAKVVDNLDTPPKEAKMIKHRRDLIKKASPRILAAGWIIEQLLKH